MQSTEVRFVLGALGDSFLEGSCGTVEKKVDLESSNLGLNLGSATY